MNSIDTRVENEDYSRNRYLANRKKILAQVRAYALANPESHKRAAKRYYEKNAERIKRERRERYALRKEQEASAHKAWVEANRHRRIAKTAAWRAANKERRQAYDAIYRESHREARAETQNIRRARKIGNGGRHTKQQWEFLKEAYGHRCAYCRSSGRLTKDHALPLSRGGGDEIENILPACLPCNRRKHSKTAEEFAELFDAEAPHHPRRPPSRLSGDQGAPVQWLALGGLGDQSGPGPRPARG